MTPTIELTGEVTMKQEISMPKALKIMEIVFEDEDADPVQNASEDGEGSAEPEQEYETLPDSFFSRLTQRQEAYVRILWDADDWLTNEEVRRLLDEEHGLKTGGPQGISGIRSGFTRKYGKGFSVDEREWIGSQNQYRLNPKYRKEIEDHWG